MEHKATCALCEAMLGLRVQVVEGRIADIRGNADDVWSRGHLCPKGVSLRHIHNDPDRLRRPLVRRPLAASTATITRTVVQESGRTGPSVHP